MPLPFNKTLDLKLLELVKENPILYNIKHSKYLDFDAREVVWQKIGDTLSRPAAEFGGIQCHVQFGDFEEEKHKPGFIENLNEYLPETYSNSWGIEKKVLKAYRKHQGLTTIGAKNLYIMTARELPTYGVTFFVVKEKQKDKKKMVPRLLGISAEAILRLDENTKEILQQWPLTQVKTYHVGKSETFTLNFGDYSDKEYSCKTQDAFRIRDILEGYIDIIRKRMFSKPSGGSDESAVISQEYSQSSKAQVIQHVQGGAPAVKQIQELYVGPTKIEPYSSGTPVHHGTHIVTMQQIIQNNQLNSPQHALGGQDESHNERSSNYVRKLKRMNSNSVKIVTLLTDPTEANLSDTRALVSRMKDDIEQVELEAPTSSLAADELNELHDLINHINKLTNLLNSPVLDMGEAKDAAEKIAHLSSEMCCALDPRSRRTSELLNRSRKSFLAEEKLQESGRRVSLISAAGNALHNLQRACVLLDKDVPEQQLSEADKQQLMFTLDGRIAKLNGALGLYLTAKADPNNIDYAAAIDSMNTVSELSTHIVADAQKLFSTEDPTRRKELLEECKALFESAKKICELTGIEDQIDVVQATNNYASVAKNLLITFSRGANIVKENEIFELARRVGDGTSQLLACAGDIAAQFGDRDAGALKLSAVQCAGAARHLLACARVAAPAIRSAHCRSALTASVERLRALSARLASACDVHQQHQDQHQDQHQHQDQQDLDRQVQLAHIAHQRQLQLQLALQQLKEAYEYQTPETEASPHAETEMQRVKYMRTFDELARKLDSLNCVWRERAPLDEKEESCKQVVKQLKEKEAHRRFTEQIAQLHAALGALLTTTTDNPDYPAAEQALQTIYELISQIVKDLETMSLSQDEVTRKIMQQKTLLLHDGIRELLDKLSSARQDTNIQSGEKIASASSKLISLTNPKADRTKEKQLSMLSRCTYNNAAELLSQVYRLKGTLAEDMYSPLEEKCALTQRAAMTLLTVSQVTAATISEVRCSTVLESAVERLKACATELTTALKASEHTEIKDAHLKLENVLEEVLQICMMGREGDITSQDVKRLIFLRSKTETRKLLEATEKQLSEPVPSAGMSEEDREIVQRGLTERLATLNTTITALASNTHDPQHLDYSAANQALVVISEHIPQVVKEVGLVASVKDDATRQLLLEHVKKLYGVSREICDKMGQQCINEAAVEFTSTAVKLVYVLSADDENEIDVLEVMIAEHPDTHHEQPEVKQNVLDSSLDEKKNSLSVVKKCLEDTKSLLKQPAGPKMSSPHVAEAERRLWERVARLNAAVAALSAACTDRAKPDYVGAKDAANIIMTLMPQIVEDSMMVCGSKEPAAQMILVQQVEQLCDTCISLCDNLTTPQNKSNIISQFATASNNLINTIRPTADGNHKENKIRDLVVTSCEQVSELLSQLQMLKHQLPPQVSSEVGTKGTHTIDAAKSLFCVAQVVVPSVGHASCQQVLVSAVRRLEGALRELCSAPQLLPLQPQHALLQTQHALLQEHIDKLLQALIHTQVKPEDLSEDHLQEMRRQQFINSLPETRRRLDEAQSLLQQGVSPTVLPKQEVQTLLRQLVDKLVQLNVAITTLSATTTDPERAEDYATIQQTTDIVGALMPQIVQDTMSLSASHPDSARKAMLQLVQQLCEVIRDFCDKAPQPQACGASAKFAATIGQLIYLFSPSASNEKERRIMEFSSLSCLRASELVSKLQVLTGQVAREVAARLDGAAADTAHALLSLAQVTASSKNSPHWQKSLEVATETLQQTAEKLHSTSRPHATPADQVLLDHSLTRLRDSLHLLLEAGREASLGTEEPDQQRIQFIRNVSTAAGRHLDDAAKFLKEPVSKDPLTDKQIETHQQQVGRRLGQLNLSVAELTAAITDHKSPDYVAAERSIITITENMPKVIQDSKTLSSSKDDTTKSLIQDNLTELYDAVRNICDNAEDAKKLNEASLKFANTSGKLVELVSTSQQEQDISTSQTLNDKEKDRLGPQQAVCAGRSHTDLLHTHDLLYKLRLTESYEHDVAKKQNIKTKEDKDSYKQFCNVVDSTVNDIYAAHDSVKSVHKAKTVRTPGVDLVEIASLEQSMEDTLARAAVQLSTLLSFNYSDRLDHKAAAEPIVALTKSVESIVNDGIMVSSALPENARNTFLTDLMELCNSTVNIFQAAQNDNMKLNTEAITFGNQSTKLLRFVCADVNYALEKEVMRRAQCVGDTASRLAQEASGVAGGAALKHMYAAGAHSVDAAGKLVYTAKLVAPTFHHPICQDILVTSADKLCSELATFTDSWKSLASEPHTSKLKEEVNNLTTLLRNLKSDVKSGKFGKKKEVNGVVMLDTPLRKMVFEILDTANEMIEHGELQAEVKQQYREYCNKLETALRTLDIANARYQRANANKDRRIKMEIAIQELQITLLQTRPSRAGQENHHIVDLRDFLQVISAESEQLHNVADSNQLVIGQELTADIKLVCNKIIEDTKKLTDSTYHVGDDSSDDMVDIYEFGQACNLLLEELHTIIKNLPNHKARKTLRAKLLPIILNCNFIRFAANSAVLTAKAAAYEMALQDLEHFDKVVLGTLLEQLKKLKKESVASSGSGSGSGAGVMWRRVARHVLAPHAARALAGAAISAAHYSDDEDSLETINEVVQQVQRLTECNTSRLANWQEPEISQVHEVLQKINYSSAHKSKLKIEVLKEQDTNKLFVCQKQKMEGTRSQLEEKFQEMSTKLCLLSGTIFLNLKKPESLAGSLHAIADAAAQLASIARSLKDNKKPVQCKRIEESAQEMCLATYSLLMTSEELCQNPDQYNTRRTLLDACHYLNETINKLNRGVYPTASVQRECSSLLRVLQLERDALGAGPQPAAATCYAHCIDALHSQRDVLQKLNNDQETTREEFFKSMLYVTTAVVNTAHCAAHATYLLSVSEKHKEAALQGVVDVHKLHKSIALIHDTCISLILDRHQQLSELQKMLEKQVDDLVEYLEESEKKISDEEARLNLQRCRKQFIASVESLYNAINEGRALEWVVRWSLCVWREARRVAGALQHPALLPRAALLSPATRGLCRQLDHHAVTLLTDTQELIKEIKVSPDTPIMKWSSYSKRKQVLASFDALLKFIKSSGRDAGVLGTELDESTQNKSYIQMQVETAFKWLHKPMVLSDVKTKGQTAVSNILDRANKICEELSHDEKEDIQHVMKETELLFLQCCKKYDQDQYGLLMERLRELQKAIERLVVTRLVEDFMTTDEPLANYAALIDNETDSESRKLMTQNALSALCAQLQRVRSAAQLAALHAAPHRAALLAPATTQMESLAPILVNAADERMYKPYDKVVVENYEAILAKYTEAVTNVRDLCDRSVDPMDFVQTAGETMQKMKQDSARQSDPIKCTSSSILVTKLAKRVIQVGLSSSSVRDEPELQRALTNVQLQLTQASGGSRMPDWQDTAAKMLRTTEEVESVLGGETIFNKQPDTNEPIYNQALNLHVAIREWSSRDNEIVAVAKRMAVLMAKLSGYMNTEKQREVLTTSKAIVDDSHEVARLAKKLAHECSDNRIKTNLLQVCVRIPTISGQLKMLTTVKGSSLGNQSTTEDQEAMNMIVGNAQSLMISIQDVVNAAASASVKIMSQSGPQIKWVRKVHY